MKSTTVGRWKTSKVCHIERLNEQYLLVRGDFCIIMDGLLQNPGQVHTFSNFVRDAGQEALIRDCPGHYWTVGSYDLNE